jgi:tetratricopeptide (TPR) repeat protein
MRRSASLGLWSRREAVLGAFLAATAAVAALSIPFHALWLKVVSLVVAAVGAAAGLVIVWRRTRLEGRREQAEMDRRLRAPVTTVSQIDPTLIGVDKAAGNVLGGSTLPAYLPRRVDDQLHDAIKAALTGKGPWMVVAVGGSKVGKSRSIYEALRRCDGAGDRMQLVAPVDGDALRSLLQPGQAVLTDEAAVLWLDDLEPFLNEGVTLQTLREWRSSGPVRIVATTYGGKGSDLVAGSTIGGITTIAADVLQHGREVPVDRTNADELAPLRAELADAQFDAAIQHGLAAYLVAGPLIRRKLITGRHSPGDPECPEGVAVVNAAIDWARCGRTDPISEELLNTLWPNYTATGATANDIRAGLDWALRPVAASISLLQHESGYQAYDYVVRLRRELSAAAPPPHAAVWRAAITTASPTQAYGVAIAAMKDRPSDALEAISKAVEAPVPEVSANAEVILGNILFKLGRLEDAMAAHERVFDRYGDDPEPALRSVAALALGQSAICLYSRSPDDAVATCQRIVDRYGDDPDPGCRRVAVRSLNLQALISAMVQKRWEEAVTAYQRVIDRYGDDPDPVIRSAVADALHDQARALKELGRVEEATAASQRVIDRYGDDPDPVVRSAVAEAMLNQANALKELGRVEEATAAYQEVVDRFGNDRKPRARASVAMALVNQGRAMQQLGRVKEAIDNYQRAIDRYGDDQDLSLHGVNIQALLAQAGAMKDLGELEDALTAYRRGFERQTYFSQFIPGWHGAAAEALRGQGGVLTRLGRLEEAKTTYQRVIDGYGDDIEPSVRRQVALAMYERGMVLKDLGRSEDANATHKQVVDRYGGDANLHDVVELATCALQK